MAFASAMAILFIRRDRDLLPVTIAEQWRLWRDLKELRRAARSGDPHVARAAIYTLTKRDPSRWQACLQDFSVRNGLAVLDESLFGLHESAMPNLRSLNKSIARAWKAAKDL
jgi:hypothetical protein